MAQENAKNAIQLKLIEKAWNDEVFRKELIENPKAAIQKELEVVIPDDIEIKVVEETDKTFYLVLPQKPSETGDVDSDDNKAMTYT